MTKILGGITTLDDNLQMLSLTLRAIRNQVISSNIANAETPGFRAIGYDFEKQLQAVAGTHEPFPMRATNPKHFHNDHTDADGTIRPDVYVQPSESVGHDGNTVDVDSEMGRMAQNQILYRSTIELLNRKFGMLRYAITTGGR